MLDRKRPTPSSFGPDGRRTGAVRPVKKKAVLGAGIGCRPRTSLGSASAGGVGGGECGAGSPGTGSVLGMCGLPPKRGSSALFKPGARLIVQRAPVMGGLGLSVQKKFQRPMVKRRAYGKDADVALRKASLGGRRRMDGMSKLMARAGKGLAYKLPSTGGRDDGSCSDSDAEEEEKEPDKPFERLRVWISPHNGAEPKGLPPTLITEMQPDEFGVEEPVTVLRPAPASCYRKDDQYVPDILAKWLRPHQREGVEFLYECVMEMRNFNGNGCILADDMGLGKTLMSVCLIYTLLKTGITPNREPTAKRVIVVCPCSLVKNWDNEFIKWLGPGAVKAMALAESDRKTVEKNMDLFVRTKMFNVLICSYETIRTHIGRLNKALNSCDLLVCDEAHRLKNSENQTSMALASLPCRRRVLLTGTPMQNDLQEFFAMVDFTNPGVLGTQEEFRKNVLFPILRGREPDATDRQREKMVKVQNDMSTTVNDFILRRINTLNAQHLPPKLVQVVCCNLTEIQRNMYEHLVNSKDAQHVLDGKQVNCLSSIQMLMKLSNHPSLVADEDDRSGGRGGVGGGRRAASKKISYSEEEKSSAAPGADGISKFMPFDPAAGGRNAPVRPEWSGKMFVLWRLMREMRRPGNGNDKIVIISNYTQTLDLIGKMCRENSWGFCRLDGSIAMKKRQKMVEDFNDPGSSLVAFLLSSKAGGCGLNLIGGNRLVLFDPDWNPAVDKQAAARCWRDGQKKRCFTYRFLATGTVEEKIFQRQLSKEGLQSVVDDKEQVNALSTKDLRNLFKLRHGTPSDTHDKLRCDRCKIIADNQELEAERILPKKLAACRELLERMMLHEDAERFTSPLKPEEEGVSAEEYDKRVKRPIDLGTIRSRLDAPPNQNGAYKSVSNFSKDVNRIFSNVMKCWDPGHDLADTARQLQSWWVDEWTALVPRLMSMQADDDDDEKMPEPNAEGEEGEDFCSAQVNNERGDDFQEQIGMPDEENMRHWSHHYNPDTVDDPVFRAAMRNTDSVSFVFGLEVTWSLIQQRRQEEEEKQAMEALQMIEEQEADGDGASEVKNEDVPDGIDVTSGVKVEDDGDKKADGTEMKIEDRTTEVKTEEQVIVKACEEVKVEDVKIEDGTPESAPAAVTESEKETEGGSGEETEDEEWDLSKVFSRAEIESLPPLICQTDGCQRRACAQWTSAGSKQTWDTCEDCQQEDYDGWNGYGPSDEAHLAAIQKWCSGDVPIATDVPPPPQDRAVVHEEAAQGKENVAPDGDSSEESAASSPTTSTEWACHSCTFSNAASRKTCQMCSKKRKK